MAGKRKRADPSSTAKSASARRKEPAKANPEPEKAEPRKSLLEGIAKQFNNPDHADVKIHIGKYELPAHSLVLASQSPFFQTALNGNFREGKEKMFQFDEADGQPYWRTFEYMYTGNYAEEPAQVLNVRDGNNLVKHARVYFAAEFFMIDNLKQLALERFKSKLGPDWVCDELVACIREIYKNTTESETGLRRAVVEAAHKSGPELWQKKEFRDLVSEGGDFAVDMMGISTGWQR